MLNRLFQRIREFFSPAPKTEEHKTLAPQQDNYQKTVVGDNAIVGEAPTPTTIVSPPVAVSEPKPDVQVVPPVVVTLPVVEHTEIAGTQEEVHPTLHAYVGDITQYDGDAIVNAANSQLMAGGGVCGAIFRAAGHHALQEACNDVGPCPTGQARATGGFDLAAKYIIHAVGPIYEPEQDNAALLASAYRSSLEEAIRVGAKSIAFPAISTGIYGYPLGEATSIAVKTVYDFCKQHPEIERVDFTCFSPEILAVYENALEEVMPPKQSYGFDM